MSLPTTPLSTTPSVFRSLAHSLTRSLLTSSSNLLPIPLFPSFALLFQLLEVVRRCVWAVLRIEWECVNSHGESRVPRWQRG